MLCNPVYHEMLLLVLLKSATAPPALYLICRLVREPLDPDLGGACRAAGGGAAGVNHMNVPPEQIRSDGAARPGRP